MEYEHLSYELPTSLSRSSLEYMGLVFIKRKNVFIFVIGTESIRTASLEKEKKLRTKFFFAPFAKSRFLI